MNANIINLADETKTASSSYQLKNTRSSPYAYILERPQTINLNADFNFDVAKLWFMHNFFYVKGAHIQFSWL